MRAWKTGRREAAVLIVLFVNSFAYAAGPAPGDVFRDYSWFYYDLATGKQYLALTGGEGRYEPGSLPDGAIAMPGSIDLAYATKAEAVVTHFHNHFGFGGIGIRVNDHSWVAIPFSAANPDPLHHHTLGSPAVALPLDHLTAGAGNRFVLKVDGSGAYTQIYNVTFRIYYDGARKQHPGGRILTPVANGAVGDTVELTAEVSGRTIKRVEYVGLYNGYNIEGDGEYRRWHYLYYHGQMRYNLGTLTLNQLRAPYRFSWDASMVPDQETPMQIAAVITDDTGMKYMTPASGGLRFSRPGITVELCRPYDVPTAFGNGGYTNTLNMSEKFTVTGPVARIQRAEYGLSAWNGFNVAGFRVNNTELAGPFPVQNGHSHIMFTRAPLKPASALQAGANTFTVGNHTSDEAHGICIAWPGIMAAVRYWDGTVGTAGATRRAGALLCSRSAQAAGGPAVCGIDGRQVRECAGVPGVYLAVREGRVAALVVGGMAGPRRLPE